MATAGRVLVYGGKGALGSTVVKYFRDKNWWVASIDLFANDDASANIVVPPSESWNEQNTEISTKVAEALGENKLDAILCGWRVGWWKCSFSSKCLFADLIKNADLMWKQSVWTSVIASSLGAKHLKPNGVLVLTGAQAALQGSPGMIGYGMAKAAVHHLVHSLADSKSGLPSDTYVAAILPVTLDTPMNRKFMPKADFSKWTPLETVSGLLYKWIGGQERPASGSLVQLITKDGNTECIPAQSSEL